MNLTRSKKTFLSILVLIPLVIAGYYPSQASAGSPSLPMQSFFAADGNGGYRLFSSTAVLIAQPDGLGLSLAGKDESASLHIRFSGGGDGWQPESEMPGHFSDLRGDPSIWRRGLPMYSRLRLAEVAPGYDLILDAASTTESGSFPVNWRLASRPGSATSELVMTVEGALDARLDGTVLVLTTPVGQVALSLPVPASAAGKARLKPVAAGVYDLSIPLRAGSTGGFLRRQAQDNGFQLLNASYLGGSARDSAYAVAVDSSGAVYLAGETTSPDFPATTNQTNQQVAQIDAYLVKMAPDGSQLEYAVLMGGGSLDSISALAVENGIAYVAGDTWSQNFPAGATPRGDNDAWAAAVAPDGSGFLYTLRVGGADQDRAHALAVQSGQVTLTGVTWSADFPASGYVNNGDVFVLRLNEYGQLVSSALFGGSDVDAAFGLSQYGSRIAVCGQTWSRNFPLRGLRGEADGFVLFLNDALELEGGAVFGGALEDSVNACAFDAGGAVYAAGRTESPDFPAESGTLAGGRDAFVAQLDLGGELERLVFLGGSGLDLAASLAFSPDGTLWVAGRTDSSDFPAPEGSLQYGTRGGVDAFAARYQPGRLSEGPLMTVLLGGSGDDQADGLAIAVNGQVYLSGRTRSADFPVNAGAMDSALSGSEDAFIARLGLPEPVQEITPTEQPPLPTATEGEALLLITETSTPTLTALPTATEMTASPRPANTEQPPASITPGSETDTTRPEGATASSSLLPQPEETQPPEEPLAPAFPWQGLLAGLVGAALIGVVVWRLKARKKTL